MADSPGTQAATKGQTYKLTSDARIDPPIQQLNLLSVLPGSVGGTTSFNLILGGVLIVRSLLSLSVNP